MLIRRRVRKAKWGYLCTKEREKGDTTLFVELTLYEQDDFYNVTSIGTFVFDNCKSLISIIIPNSVTSIGTHAFNGCTSLTSVTIGNGITSIDRGAFRGCTSLTSVTFQGTIPSSGFNDESNWGTTPGDLRAKFYATDSANGTPGTYTGPSITNATWTRQP